MVRQSKFCNENFQFLAVLKVLSWIESFHHSPRCQPYLKTFSAKIAASSRSLNVLMELTDDWSPALFFNVGRKNPWPCFFWIKCMNQVAKSSSIKLKQLSSIAPHPWVSANPEVPRGFILGWRLSVGKTYPIGETNPKRSRKNLRNLPFLLWFGLQGKWTKKKQRGVVPVRFRRDFPPNFPWFLS